MGWKGERVGLDPGSVAERKSERGMKQGQCHGVGCDRRAWKVHCVNVL